MDIISGEGAKEFMEERELFKEKFKKKLNPNRFRETKPRFAALVMAVIEHRSDLYIDAGGLIFDKNKGFLETKQNFTEFWENLITSPEAGLAVEEQEDLRISFKCCMNFWRCEAPDKKPYMQRMEKAMGIAYSMTNDPKEFAILICEIMSRKNRNPLEN
jgi:hypothetical protein